MKKINIITAKGDGFGYGHFNRMRILADYLTDCPGNNFNVELFTDYPDQPADIFIFDRRENPTEIIRKYREYPGAKIVLLDDHGGSREMADCIIDSLPILNKDIFIPAKPVSYFSGFKYLILAPELLEYKKKIRMTPSDYSGKNRNNRISILFSLGSYMEQNYSELIRKGLKGLPVEVRIIDRLSPSEFYQTLAECDIFVTYFGISLFEADLLQKKIFLINPTDYHSRLSETVESIQIINCGLISDRGIRDLIDSLGEYVKIKLSPGAADVGPVNSNAYSSFCVPDLTTRLSSPKADGKGLERVVEIINR
ncbi:MAG: hypothetical protein KAS39_05910, partial [Actinomycetia bacterium]|nr:hypothetical protein [Actinomycetes bacterium]